MKERPIIFQPAMAQAAHEGRKTQTRRLVKPDLDIDFNPVMVNGGDTWSICTRNQSPPHFDMPQGSHDWAVRKCPYGTVGDRLYCRERLDWRDNGGDPPERGHVYAGNPEMWVEELTDEKPLPRARTVSPIHMPRWACRTVLELTDIRVQRLQDISTEDILAEGISDRDELEPDRAAYWKITQGRFITLWESINGPGSWDANPWVWALTFKKVEVTP